MKTGAQTADDFAKELYTIGLKQKNYNFDICYDIHNIVSKKNKRYNTDVKEKNTWHLFVSEMNTHSFFEKDVESIEENIKMYSTEADEHYKIVFTFNCNYFDHKKFAIVTKIK